MSTLLKFTCDKRQIRSHDYADVFDLAPVSIWIEDLSRLKLVFDAWRRAGIDDLRSYLRADLTRVRQCVALIDILKVNQKTLQLFEADSLEILLTSLDTIFSADMLPSLIEEFCQLWSGKAETSLMTASATSTGRRLDLLLSGKMMQGYEDSWGRYIVAVEDVTNRENAFRQAAENEAYARDLFENSPVSLWVKDYSGVKRLLDDLKARGVSSLDEYLQSHPAFLKRCMSAIAVLDVNEHTLRLLKAPDKVALVDNLDLVFGEATILPFRAQLLDLWDGRLNQQREVEQQSLDGKKLHLRWEFSVLPSRQSDWSRVQVALTDITENKRNQASLEFIGSHDALTGLHNRASHMEEIRRLSAAPCVPLSVIVVDLNGLKRINDNDGHMQGDIVLRRAGHVLGEFTLPPSHIARIGGDEFAIILPGVDEHGVQAVMVVKSLAITTP